MVEIQDGGSAGQQHFRRSNRKILLVINSLLLLSRKHDLAMLLVFIAGWEVSICHETLLLSVITRLLVRNTAGALATAVANPYRGDSMADEHPKSTGSDTSAQSQKSRDNKGSKGTAEGTVVTAKIAVIVSVWTSAATATPEGQLVSCCGSSGACSSDEGADTGKQEILVALGPSSALLPRKFARWGRFNIVLDEQERPVFNLDHMEVNGVHGNGDSTHIDDAEMDDKEFCAGFIFRQFGH